MKQAKRDWSRRAFLTSVGVLGATVPLGHGRALAASRRMGLYRRDLILDHRHGCGPQTLDRY